MRAARAASNGRRAEDAISDKTLTRRRPLSASPHRGHSGSAPISTQLKWRASALAETTRRLSRDLSATYRSRPRQGLRKSERQQHGHVQPLLLAKSGQQDRFPMPYPGIDDRVWPPRRAKSPPRVNKVRSPERKTMRVVVNTPKKKRVVARPGTTNRQAVEPRLKPRCEPTKRGKTVKARKRPRSAHVALSQDFPGDRRAVYATRLPICSENRGDHQPNSRTVKTRETPESRVRGGLQRQRARPASAPTRRATTGGDEGALTALSRMADGSYNSPRELRIMKWIVLRETYLDKLHDVVSASRKRAKRSSKNGVPTRHRTEKERTKLFNLLADLLTVLRRITVEIVEAVEKWRGSGSQRPFVWGTSNYLVKAAGDVAFLAKLPGLEEHLGVAIKNNPFLCHVRLDGRPAFLSPVTEARGSGERGFTRASSVLSHGGIASKSLGVSPERIEAAAAILNREVQVASIDRASNSADRRETNYDYVDDSRRRQTNGRDEETLDPDEERRTGRLGSRMSKSNMRRESARSNGVAEEECRPHAHPDNDSRYYHNNDQGRRIDMPNEPYSVNALEQQWDDAEAMTGSHLHGASSEVLGQDGHTSLVSNETQLPKETLVPVVRAAIADEKDEGEPPAKIRKEQSEHSSGGASNGQADATTTPDDAERVEVRRAWNRRGSPFSAIHNMCDGLLTELQANGLGVVPGTQEGLTEDEVVDPVRTELTSWEMQEVKANNNDATRDEPLGETPQKKHGLEIMASFRGKKRRRQRRSQLSDDDDESDDVETEEGSTGKQRKRTKTRLDRKRKAFVAWAGRTEARQNYRDAKATRYYRQRLLKGAVSVWESYRAEVLGGRLAEAFCGQFGFSGRYYLRATFNILRANAKGAQIAARYRSTLHATSDRLEVMGRVRVRQAWRRWAYVTNETAWMEQVHGDNEKEENSMGRWLMKEDEGSKSLSFRDADRGGTGGAGVAMAASSAMEKVGGEENEAAHVAEAPAKGTSGRRGLGAKLKSMKSFRELTGKSQTPSFRSLVGLTTHIMGESQAKDAAATTAAAGSVTTSTPLLTNPAAAVDAELEHERELMRERKREICKAATAATCIQRSWRAMRERPIALRAALSATLVQRVWRLKVKRASAAVTIIRAWRRRTTVKSRMLREALLQAAGVGDLRAVSFLLRKKTVGVLDIPSADVHAKIAGPDGGVTPLHVACRGEFVSKGELKPNAMKDASMGDDGKGISTAVAKRNGRFGYPEWVGVIEALVEAGAGLEVKDNDGRTPMMAAAEGGSGDTVSALVRMGGEVDTMESSGEGRTPLIIAAQRANASAAAVLLEYGARANRTVLDDSTPLHEAAGAGSIEVAEMLVRSGAKVDAQTQSAGMSPLHLAIANDQHGAARLLVHSGADVSLPDHRGLTPLRLAVEVADKATVELLLAAEPPAEVDIEDKKGRTELHAACRQGLTEVAKVLLEAGADPHARDRGGRTPELVALDFGQADCAALFYNLAIMPSVRKTHGKRTKLETAATKSRATGSATAKFDETTASSSNSDRQSGRGGRSSSSDDTQEDVERGMWWKDERRQVRDIEHSDSPSSQSRESTYERRKTRLLESHEQEDEGYLEQCSGDTDDTADEEEGEGRAEIVERNVTDEDRGPSDGSKSSEGEDEIQDKAVKAQQMEGIDNADLEYMTPDKKNDGSEWAWTSGKGWQRLRLGVAYAVEVEQRASSADTGSGDQADGGNADTGDDAEWTWTAAGGWQKLRLKATLDVDDVDVTGTSAIPNESDGAPTRNVLQEGGPELRGDTYDDDPAGATNQGCSPDFNNAERWKRQSILDHAARSFVETGRLSTSDTAAGHRSAEAEADGTAYDEPVDYGDQGGVNRYYVKSDAAEDKSYFEGKKGDSHGTVWDSAETRRQPYEEGYQWRAEARTGSDDPSEAPRALAVENSSLDAFPAYDIEHNRRGHVPLTAGQPQIQRNGASEKTTESSAEADDGRSAAGVKQGGSGWSAFAGPLKVKSEWTALLDRNSGSTYYLNQQSGLTQWEAPQDVEVDDSQLLAMRK